VDASHIFKPCSATKTAKGLEQFTFRSRGIW